MGPFTDDIMLTSGLGFAAGHSVGFVGISVREKLGVNPPNIYGPGTAIKIWELFGWVRGMFVSEIIFDEMQV